MWKVVSVPEYEDWFKQLDDDSRKAISAKVEVLIEYGPELSRPHADTLKGSRISNLKELRANTEAHIYRIAYCFDPERKAIILTAGDKKGKNEKRFYKSLIAKAEEIIKKYNILSKGDKK